MPDEPIAEISPYPYEVTLADGTYTVLDPEGDPGGARVKLPSGVVTSLNNHGGLLDHLSETDLTALATIGELSGDTKGHNE